jgi:4-hydroxy-3-methylbut-2-enyl diphosphate reductase
MQILIAENAGFCEGVERAYQIALLQTKAGRPIFMLGNLVHNTQVVDKFIKLGVKTVKNLAEIPKNSNGVLLISAHGIPPQIYKKAKELGLVIVDTTCSWVKKAQKIVRELVQGGDLIIIVGDKGHPEVKGLVGWSQDQAIIIENLEEVKSLSLSPDKKIDVMAQTTQAEEHFADIVAEIKKKVKNVSVYNTICGATSKRQKAAVALAKRVDLMLIIGDKMSANTKRLTELCSNTKTETHQIQSADELDLKWLANKEKIGITAGASTPEWVIKEVTAKIKG